jgi:hypothetical protein
LAVVEGGASPVAAVVVLLIGASRVKRDGPAVARGRGGEPGHLPRGRQ